MDVSWHRPITSIGLSWNRSRLQTNNRSLSATRTARGRVRSSYQRGTLRQGCGLIRVRLGYGKAGARRGRGRECLVPVNVMCNHSFSLYHSQIYIIEKFGQNWDKTCFNNIKSRVICNLLFYEQTSCVCCATVLSRRLCVVYCQINPRMNLHTGMCSCAMESSGI